MPHRLRVLAISFSAGLCVLLGAPASEANGRFPRGELLIERNGNSNELTLGATYGLLFTNDRGVEWRHVCELGFAFAFDEIDPVLGVFSDEAMLVKGSRSLNRAPAPYCAFEPVLGGSNTETAVDFTLDRTTLDRVVALEMLRGDGGGVVNQLFVSTDAARTFVPYGEPLPDMDVAFGITVDVAPSDARRIYVSATGRTASQVFARSDDGAASWTTVDLMMSDEEYPYIAAVDPQDPDHVYVRTDFWATDDQGIVQANDGLFYSDDGGRNFRLLYRAAGKLFGFALSPDGSEVLIGYGDPVDPSRQVDEAALGIYRASTSDFMFEKIYEGSVSCLAWTAAGLYACTPQDTRGYALGIAPNADFDLATPDPFTPLLELPDVRPLDCPACTSAADCLPEWPQACAVFGNCDAGTVAPATGGTTCTSGGASSGGAGGVGGNAAGAGGTSGVGASNNRPPSEPPSDSSCGCRAVGAGASAGSFATFLVAFVALARRRRLRRED
ncbi:MAG TPA: MYXO-CTERM sorting domain-containing protein [Polyangiaceae bacterium]